jgi:putative transposase
MRKSEIMVRVISIALMIAYGINSEGKRDILAIEPMYGESEETWREFFRKLKHRGVRKICLCISDAHQGIQKALKTEWISSSWQLQGSFYAQYPGPDSP